MRDSPTFVVARCCDPSQPYVDGVGVDELRTAPYSSNALVDVGVFAPLLESIVVTTSPCMSVN